MTKKILKILAINTDTRYVGIAVFQGLELEDWRVKVFKGKLTDEKCQKIMTLVRSFADQYEPNVLAIKKLHRSRSSPSLNRLTGRIKQLSKRRGLKVCEYSIKDLEAFFFPERKTNKKKLVEILASKYPALSHDFNKEQNNKNAYHIRMFEAVALGAACSHQLYKR